MRDKEKIHTHSFGISIIRNTYTNSCRILLELGVKDLQYLIVIIVISSEDLFCGLSNRRPMITIQLPSQSL